MLYKVFFFGSFIILPLYTVHKISFNESLIHLSGGMQNFAMNADSAALFLSAQILQETQSFFLQTKL